MSKKRQTWKNMNKEQDNNIDPNYCRQNHISSFCGFLACRDFISNAILRYCTRGKASETR